MAIRSGGKSGGTNKRRPGFFKTEVNKQALEFASKIPTSTDTAFLEQASRLEGGKGGIGASGMIPSIRMRAQERLDEVLRQKRRAGQRPGLAATILTSGLRLSPRDDVDSTRRPTLLGGG